MEQLYNQISNVRLVMLNLVGLNLVEQLFKLDVFLVQVYQIQKQTMMLHHTLNVQHLMLIIGQLIH